jgi:tRNA threonylcarbamoyl adenosine modification protein YeaZ
MYHASLDLSGSEAVFALQRIGDGAIICEESKPMRGRTASGMAPWILELLAANGAAPGSVVRWTVGAGPGSFTGMRLAAAFVAGLTAGKEVETRCVPTAVALAHDQSGKDGEKAATLFDGRNQEILVYPLAWSAGEWIPCGEPAVLNREQAAEYFRVHSFNYFMAHENELEAIRKIAGFLTVTPCRIHAAGLLNARYAPWNNDLTELVYIRPAVHTDGA